jgi:hypothetical protein
MKDTAGPAAKEQSKAAKPILQGYKRRRKETNEAIVVDVNECLVLAHFHSLLLTRHQEPIHRNALTTRIVPINAMEEHVLPLSVKDGEMKVTAMLKMNRMA